MARIGQDYLANRVAGATVMDRAESLAGQLRGLTADLEDPQVDLLAMHTELLTALHTTVPTFLGFTIMLHLAGRPVRLTSMDDDGLAAARCCVLLSLDSADGIHDDDGLALYAAAAGAFDQLAGRSNEWRVTKAEPGSAQIGPCRPGIEGLAEFVTANRAIGMLIDNDAG